MSTERLASAPSTSMRPSHAGSKAIRRSKRRCVPFLRRPITFAKPDEVRYVGFTGKQVLLPRRDALFAFDPSAFDLIRLRLARKKDRGRAFQLGLPKRYARVVLSVDPCPTAAVDDRSVCLEDEILRDAKRASLPRNASP